MSNKNGKAGDSVWYAALLPGTFTTGFKRDLTIAREIIQRRNDLRQLQERLSKQAA
jgi:hypothetical protein